MGAVIQSQPQRNDARPAHWDRLERADLFDQYRVLRTQGLSERQAANELKVPRTTLQAWRLWHNSLDICAHVAEFFQSGPGLAFLHRLVIAFHLVCVEVGACGIRLVCLFLHLTGLDRFVAASYGAQQQVNVHIERAMVTYGHDETTRLANGMPQKDLAQFIGLCSSLKWSRHLTKSPFLALPATAGSNAAYKIISACSNAVS